MNGITLERTIEVQVLPVEGLALAGSETQVELGGSVPPPPPPPPSPPPSPPSPPVEAGPDLDFKLGDIDIVTVGETQAQHDTPPESSSSSSNNIDDYQWVLVPQTLRAYSSEASTMIEEEPNTQPQSENENDKFESEPLVDSENAWDPQTFEDIARSLDRADAFLDAIITYFSSLGDQTQRCEPGEAHVQVASYDYSQDPT